MRAGHTLDLLLDPHAAWQQLRAALAAARHTIDIELYFLAEDAVGAAFVDDLIAAAGRGVRVRLVLDAVGSVRLAVATRRRLVQNGVELRLYHASGLPALPDQVLFVGHCVSAVVRLDRAKLSGLLAPLAPGQWLGRRQRWGGRNHRKVVLVDSSVGFVLGMNVSAQYFAVDPTSPTWADAGVRVEGPLVDQLLAAFVQSWSEARDPRSPGDVHPPSTTALPPPPPRRDRAALREASVAAAAVAAAHGDEAALAEVAQASAAPGCLATVALNGGQGRCEVHSRYIRAIRGAKQRVWLAHSYFLPNLGLQRALCQAARRGVDVRVLMPAINQGDIKMVSLAMDHAVGRLLDRGVRVFLMDRRMLHAKFAVVDEDWWTIGSANLDGLSRLHNLETNVVGVGAAEARPLAEYFDRLGAEARELTLESWRHRPWWQKLLGRSAWTVRAYL